MIDKSISAEREPSQANEIRRFTRKILQHRGEPLRPTIHESGNQQKVINMSVSSKLVNHQDWEPSSEGDCLHAPWTAESSLEVLYPTLKVNDSDKLSRGDHAGGCVPKNWNTSYADDHTKSKRLHARSEAVQKTLRWMKKGFQMMGSANDALAPRTHRVPQNWKLLLKNSTDLTCNDSLGRDEQFNAKWTSSPSKEVKLQVY